MKNSKIYTFLFGFLLFVVISIFYLYQNTNTKIFLFDVILKKNDELAIYNDTPKLIITKKKPNTIIIQRKDTLLKNKTILLAGDSEAGSIIYAFQKYCILNGHKLSRIIIWNSATDMAYASNDTLANNIKIYKPDYIIFIIGLNQIYQTKFDNSKVAVNKIIDQFGSIPYTWIGPANWIDDFGINKMYQETIDSGAFFLSKNLILERAEDGRHPSIKGSKIWVDSICNFLTKKAKYRIQMEKIDTPFQKQKLNILTLYGKKGN
jgi:hypothetical protein